MIQYIYSVIEECMSKVIDVLPQYYDGKEVKIIWECEDFGLAEILLIDSNELLVVDKQTITLQPKKEHYISINLLIKH